MGVMPEGREKKLQGKLKFWKSFLRIGGAVVKIDQRAILLAQHECTNRTVIRYVCILIEHKSSTSRWPVLGEAHDKADSNRRTYNVFVKILLPICTVVRNHTHSRCESRFKTCVTRSGHGLALLWKSIVLGHVLYCWPVKWWVRGH